LIDPSGRDLDRVTLDALLVAAVFGLPPTRRRRSAPHL